MKPPRTLSVIIPTVNAAPELDLALTSLNKNSDLELDIQVLLDPDLKTGKVNADIRKVCHKHKLTPHLNKNNLGPYGSWNRGASLAKSDWLVFATDDQYFAPHWDSALVACWRPQRLVAGRLVEPGLIPVWETNIKKNFGLTPDEFQEKEFIAWCEERGETGWEEGGFFIPLLLSRADFTKLGGFSTEGRFGTRGATSNDIEFIKAAKAKGYRHLTASASYSYHFQASSWKKKTNSPTIAAVVLTKNEQTDLPSCLKSLAWVSQLVVVDSGSTDQTLAIAKKHQAKLYKRQFDNFAAQRNFALTKVADYDWVLFVDADEVVEPALAQELLSFAQDIYLDGVELPRKNYIFGKWIKHSDWYPDFRLVFARPKLVKFEAGVHERLHFTRGNGTTIKANNHLVHHNYDTVPEFVRKNLLDYPAVSAASLHAHGHRFTAADLVTKPIAEFMRRFFLTEGWRDGLFGLVLSLLMGVQTLVIYAYLWELQGKRASLTTKETQTLFRRLREKGSELSYWLASMAVDNTKGAKKYLHRARRKAIKVLKGL